MISDSQLQQLINNIDSMSQIHLDELTSNFPSNQMHEISILDFVSIRLYLSLLKKFGERNAFYNRPHLTKHGWDFVLTNILALENVPEEDILSDLLELLQYFITNLNTSNKEFPHFMAKNSERILNAVTFAAKLKIFTKLYVPLCTDIIIKLLKLNDFVPSLPLPFTTSKNLADVTRVYKELQVVHEVVLLCEICFKRFTPTSEFFEVCIAWLLENGSSAMMVDEDNTKLALFKAADELQSNSYFSDNGDTKRFISILDGMSRDIVLFSGKPIMRKESLKFISTQISEYNTQELDITEDPTSLLNKLLQLPVDPNHWPLVKSDVFIYMCSYLCTRSQLVWSASDVLQSIARFVYSYDRFTMNPALLKSLCWTYSIAITDAQSKKNVLLGDELLFILSKFTYSFPKIITYHVAQLVWILKRGSRDIKKRVLVEWLRKDVEFETLKKAILLCKVGNILIDIIADSKYNDLSPRVIELCRKMQDKELAENIACTIPRTLHNRSLMGKFILANPGVPDDHETALKLCEFMSLVLCLIGDVKVLKAACVYSKNLITSLKTEKRIISTFCNDMKNIQFLAIKVKYVNEETAIEILRLLKVLVLVQKRNRSVLEGQVDADLALSMVGCEAKTEKCLDLLQIIVTSRNVFLKLENSKILDLFTKLFDTSRNPRLAVRSFICLTSILKSNQWLALVPSTNIFIEIQCSLSANEEPALEFLIFLAAWMRILKNTSGVNMVYLPDKTVVSNYIKRSDQVSQIREKHLLKLLDKI